MACDHPAIEHSSPFIKRYNATNDLSLKSLDAVRDDFAHALARKPTRHFEPRHVAVGLKSVILVYQRMSGDLAAELFQLDSGGKIIRSISHCG
ncbi:MAG: hypothetical protein ACKVZJ_09270 [Phycisphaerales bacterium]